VRPTATTEEASIADSPFTIIPGGREPGAGAAPASREEDRPEQARQHSARIVAQLDYHHRGDASLDEILFAIHSALKALAFRFPGLSVAVIGYADDPGTPELRVVDGDRNEDDAGE
jgi:hypothetical protein